LITDGMVGYVMEKQLVNKVLVGADRILKTGHVINKIGTLSIAITAGYYHIPFYVAAPLSTFDLETRLSNTAIEERSSLEVTHFLGQRIAYRGVPALNPAFDITPPKLISLLITEKGLLRPNEIDEKVSKWLEKC
jgi:methylthioribose-1-phosphate isomerase